MSEIKLTKTQVNQIKDDMERVEMLSIAQVNSIAQKVNKVINLPFINEDKEFVVIAKVVTWVDRQLYQLLPNEYYELVQDSSNGISKEEAVQIEERLTPLINDVVNIPILPEKLEGKLIGLILGVIINAMIDGFDLEEDEPA